MARTRRGHRDGLSPAPCSRPRSPALSRGSTWRVQGTRRRQGQPMPARVSSGLRPLQLRILLRQNSLPAAGGPAGRARGLPSALTCTQTFCTSQESWLWSDICRHPVPGLLPPPWPPVQPQLSQHPARLGPRVGPTCGAPAGPRGRTGRPRAGPAAALPPSHTEGTGSHCLGWPAASAAPRARGDTGWKGREKRG